MRVCLLLVVVAWMFCMGNHYARQAVSTRLEMQRVNESVTQSEQLYHELRVMLHERESLGWEEN